jgi:hypothetical protein
MLSRRVGVYDNSDAYAAIAGASSWPEQLRIYLSRTARRCTLSFDDVHAEWFRARCSRRSEAKKKKKKLFFFYFFFFNKFCFFFRSVDAERLVRLGGAGSFIVRLSESKENNLALTASSIDDPMVVSHSLIRAVHLGFAIDADTVFATLSDLVASRPELRRPAPRDDISVSVNSSAMASTSRATDAVAPATNAEPPLVTCSDVLRRLGERLRAGESVPELHWTLASLRFEMINSNATRRTVVRFASDEHISSYWLPFDANLIRLLGEAFSSSSAGGGLEALRINGWQESEVEFVHALSDADARLLARTCVNYDALVLLDLQVNRIGDSGAASLANCIGRSRGLRAVDLRHNFITFRGAMCLYRALVSNHALVRLDLWPQLRTKPPMHEVTKSQCPRLRSVIDTIDDVFRVRKDLLFGEMQLHGFLSHADAEKRLARDRAIAYVHADHPMCLIIASRSNREITRTIVRRDANGYASSPARDSRPLSLRLIAAWNVLAMRATVIAKRRAHTLGVEWTALPLVAVLDSGARALLAADCNDADEEQWLRLPRQLRTWLESGCILDVLWCAMVPLASDSSGRGSDWSDDELELAETAAPRPDRPKDLEELLYDNRQGMMGYVLPDTKQLRPTTPAPAPAAAAAAVTPTMESMTTGTEHRGGVTQKSSMFQVKI